MSEVEELRAALARKTELQREASNAMRETQRELQDRRARIIYLLGLLGMDEMDEAAYQKWLHRPPILPPGGRNWS